LTEAKRIKQELLSREKSIELKRGYFNNKNVDVHNDKLQLNMRIPKYQQMSYGWEYGYKDYSK
jgi:hypothetical protein